MKIEIDTDIDFIDKDLTISEIFIYRAIYKYCEDDIECDLSNSELSNIFNLSFPTVQKIILKLEKLKYIYVEYKRNKRTKRILKLCKRDKLT